ncbi:uncharacterized protein LOC9317622 [Arabidopsis lyrata subsp. lyrata]|nr:uncharacterized protein LOC9317622 [Arabidopsis lyrata subsp. lyrata]|eukprot:XP_002879719.2 uncharacterized protein LOC9317622 [Arabidopsis lyrata subsp. lyrata]
MLTTRLRLVTERTKLINTTSPMGIVFGTTYIMGMVFGKIVVETPKYTVTKSGDGYEIREYPPAVAAEVTYDASEFKGDKDGGFQVLAKYIGVFGKPENEKPEKIAMTAPVITKEGEKIAMTAPVITKESEKIVMTSPVVTKEGGEGGKKMVTMQFLLPSMYKKAEEAPRPTDERVVIREEGGRKYGVVKFSGTASDSVVSEKVKKLTSDLEKDGFKITGDFILARYNPPWTLPPFRTNEVMIPVE